MDSLKENPKEKSNFLIPAKWEMGVRPPVRCAFQHFPGRSQREAHEIYRVSKLAFNSFRESIKKYCNTNNFDETQNYILWKT